MKTIRISFFAASVMFTAILLLSATTMLGQDRSKSNDAKQARVAAPSSLIVENFDYPAATTLTSAGWTAHSAGGTNAMTVTAPGLTYSGWPSSGNAVTMATSGEDAHRTFAAQTTGTVYAGIVVNITDAAIDAANIGGYFFHLGPSPIGTTFRGRIFIKKDATNAISFGITKASTSTLADITYTPFSYSLGTTYLLIIKYTIVDGVTNDTVSLFINPTLGGAEPAPTVSATDIGATDINPASFALRQGSAATSPTVRVDSIRIGSSWSSLVTAPPNATVDFNGDGRTDWAVTRTVAGTGGQRTWFYNLNGTGAPTAAFAWGITGDIDVPEDYDGDGKTDIAVWRPGAATVAAFYILNSATSTARVEAFGQTSDDPTVVGDYNGDGAADLAVYRPGSQSIWYYRTVAGGPVTYVPWGTEGDFVSPGDYDGNGSADFVVQRNSGGLGQFWTLLSTGVVQPVTTFGLSTDTVVPGDYDGDGKTDIATARAAGGDIQWQYLSSLNSSINYITFGTAATDLIVQGDYDGDGRTDAAIWRAGTFWTRSTNSGAVTNFQLGLNGDGAPANYNTH